jgi:acetolactate synthase I/II/III large subunit
MSATDERTATVTGAEDRAWAKIPADEVSDAIVAAMALGGVDHLFFTSGSEIAFYQEGIAKAVAHGRPAPRLITMTHEHAGLNAALGYAMVSGKPAATAVHVDAGTVNAGGAIHTAWRSGLPVMITAGGPPVAHPGSMRGSRDGGHLWLQQTFDQASILRQYTKWDHRLEYQDNPGLLVSRALQVATSEPCGPVYMIVPREIALLPVDDATFPTTAQLGIPRPTLPDPDSVAEIARRLVAARNPFVVASGSGRNPATVPALVELCELLAIPFYNSIFRAYQCFPKNHPLYQSVGSLAEADAVLVIEANVPWMPGPNAPPADAFVAVVDIDPVKGRTPTYEFTANVRLASDSLLTIRAIVDAVRELIGPGDRGRIGDRAERWAAASRARTERAENDARARSTKSPIDPLWLSFNIGRVADDNCIVLDETLATPQIDLYLRCSQPGSYFSNPGSSGGWSPGAALGAKLAAPDRDVIAITGDGFYMYSTANAAIAAAVRHNAPFMAVIYQNRSYSTGTTGVTHMYPNSYAAKTGLEGGYFDPPVDFAKEDEAAGAYGENVRDPAQVGPALERGLKAIRSGTPAVISVWLPRILHDD